MISEGGQPVGPPRGHYGRSGGQAQFQEDDDIQGEAIIPSLQGMPL